jgi:hypothetical protein
VDLLERLLSGADTTDIDEQGPLLEKAERNEQQLATFHTASGSSPSPNPKEALLRRMRGLCGLMEVLEAKVCRSRRRPAARLLRLN